MQNHEVLFSPFIRIQRTRLPLFLLGTVLALAATSYGASISFTPTGEQLDSDPFKDLVVQVGDQIDFIVRWDEGDYTGLLKNFRWEASWNASALRLITFTAPDSHFVTEKVESYHLIAHSFDEPGGRFEEKITLMVRPGIADDRIGATSGDFRVQAIQAEYNGASVLDIFGTDVQAIDLQRMPITPVPEPSTYSLFGAIALVAAGIVRWHRRSRSVLS